MAEAQCMPDATDTAGLFLRSAEFGQNFMQRRQRMQWEQEDRTENQRVRQLFEPVMQAQRQAQIATALSSLETNKQQQQLRTRFAAEAPVYNEKFQAAMKLPTFAEQQAALAQLQPEVTWMGLLPEGKGFVDAVNNSRALAFQNQMADAKIKAEESAIRLRKEAELETIRLRNEEIRKNIQSQGEETRKTNSSRPQSNAAQRDAQRILYLREQAAQLRGVDPETADLLEKRAAYLSNPSSGGGSGLPIGWEGIEETTTTTTTPAVPGQTTPAPAQTSTNLFEGITY
jgi:hypothetical protein